jgi:hypothetical protein
VITVKEKVMYYLGPYIKFEDQYIPDMLPVCGCLNFECPRYKKEVGQAKFCFECGFRTAQFEVERLIQMVNPRAATEDENLVYETYHKNIYYYPNKHFCRLDMILYAGRREPTICAVGVVAQEINWFEQAYKSELSLLRKVYGQEGQVLWGAVWID